MIRRSAVLGAVAAALALAACGSSSNSSTSSGASSANAPTSTSAAAATSSASSGSSIQTQAAAAIKPYLTAPASITVKTPLPSKPPAGKTVDVMDCGAPACTAWADAAIQAAQALHWTAQRIEQGVTPQSITAAWNQVVNRLPDGVVTIGIPDVLFPHQLAVLKAHNIPVVNASVADSLGKGEIAVIGGAAAGGEIGKLQADYVLAQSGDKANVLSVTSPDFPITASFEKGMMAEMSSACPSCSVAKLQVSAADIGTGANTTKITGYLQSHPSINWVVANDDLTVGLPTALSTAGLASKVSIVGEAPGPTQFSYLRAGGPYKATLAFPSFEVGWETIDTVARYIEHASVAPDQAPPPNMILTKANVGKATSYHPYVANYQSQYKALWKLGT